jgi:hypothetical protein
LQLSNSAEILKAYKRAQRLDSPRTRTITTSPVNSYSSLYDALSSSTMSWPCTSTIPSYVPVRAM